MNLEEIYREYQELGLGGKNGTSENFVPGDGPCPAKLMVIGEAPGADEDRIGKPFVGPAGSVLTSLLGHNRVNISDVFLTNTFKYRPPNNRDPFPSELVASMPCLSQEIKCVNPRVIILAGKIATSVFFPGKTLRSMRGRPIEKSGRILIATYHPAVFLHSPRASTKSILRNDFKKAVEMLET